MVYDLISVGWVIFIWDSECVFFYYCIGGVELLYLEFDGGCGFYYKGLFFDCIIIVKLVVVVFVG